MEGSWACCATCCSFLSGFGVVFLVILGALMQQKSPSLELEEDIMTSQYLSSYLCAGVYLLFFVASCTYLYVHSKMQKKASLEGPAGGIFPLGSMAEAEGGAAKPAKPKGHSVDGPGASGTSGGRSPQLPTTDQAPDLGAVPT